LHRTCGDVVLVSRALGHRDLRPIIRYVELTQGWRITLGTSPDLSNAARHC
jgi:hypothetical protein